MALVSMLETYKRIGHCAAPGVFTPQDAKIIRASALEIYGHIFGTRDPKNGANTLHFDHIARQPHPWMRQFVEWVIYRFTHSEVFGLYQTLFGEKIAFPLLKCIIRYQRPDHAESILPFHQDAEGGKFKCLIVNCWTALDDCGIDAPGIEVVHGTFGDFFYGLSFVGTFKESSTPVFRAGDGCVFDHFAMHRTHITDAMTKPRMSIEIRACNAEVQAKVYGEVDRIEVNKERRRTILVRRFNPYPVALVRRFARSRFAPWRWR